VVRGVSDLMDSPSPVLSSMTDALTERQERFQESYRQLVHHYEGLVQHYQQFIRTRLGVPEETPPVLEFLPTSDSSEDTSPETSNDSPPIDIIVSENPSLQHVDVDGSERDPGEQEDSTEQEQVRHSISNYLCLYK